MLESGKTRCLLPVILVLLMAAPFAAAQSNFSADVYVKHFSIVFDATETGRLFGLPSRILGAALTRTRLNLSWKLHSRLRVRAAWNLTVRIQDPALFGSADGLGFGSQKNYRLWRFDPYLIKPGAGGSAGFQQNPDRFFLSWRTTAFDLYIGRQAIAWGGGKIINPTDVIAPFTFETLDTEERRGVDAVRLRVPLGWMSEADAGFVFGDAKQSWSNAAYLRGKTYFLQVDLSLIIMQFQGHLLAGLDMASHFAGAGIWFETALVRPDAFRGKPETPDREYWRVTLGADYNISGSWYGFLEYHYNGPGAEQPEHAYRLANKPAYYAGTVYLLGRHYGIIGLRHQASGLWTLWGQALWNISDGSCMAAPRFSYSLAQNAELTGGFFTRFGSGPEKGQPLPVMQSEFGSYPAFYYLSMQFYL